MQRFGNAFLQPKAELEAALKRHLARLGPFTAMHGRHWNQAVEKLLGGKPMLVNKPPPGCPMNMTTVRRVREKMKWPEGPLFYMTDGQSSFVDAQLIAAGAKMVDLNDSFVGDYVVPVETKSGMAKYQHHTVSDWRQGTLGVMLLEVLVSVYADQFIGTKYSTLSSAIMHIRSGRLLGSKREPYEKDVWCSHQRCQSCERRPFFPDHIERKTQPWSCIEWKPGYALNRNNF